MADTKDYLTVYRQFFDDFAKTLDPDDQLPVKVAGYYLCDSELVGEIVDWTLQYLNQKHCPSSLVAPLTRIVIEEIKLACKKLPAACGYRQAENTYQPLKLMQVVTRKVNEVCLEYRDNVKLATLPPPTPGPPISVCAIKNSRRKMEDRHVVIEDFHAVFNVEDNSMASYYAVFDGHAGTDAAVYSVSHIHQFIAESQYYPTDPERAIKDAFFRTDALFLEKSGKENLRSGTTAVCALLRPKEKMLYIAWLGDSLACLVHGGKAIQVVNPHKPDRKDERARIEDMGGCVMFWGTWRVNGHLAVSRAIGDLEYKPYVTAEPDVEAIPLNGTEDFLILACDGLWDFVKEDEVVEAVYEQIHQNPDYLQGVSESLVQLSKQRGSTDNISVIVVFLTDPAQLASRPVPKPLDVLLNMETSNNTNPFQKGSLPFLDLGKGGDMFKQNGTSPSFFMDHPSNGKPVDIPNYDDDDLGPETDVDAVDDVLMSPSKAAALNSPSNNNPFDLGEFENKAKITFEADLELQRQQMSEFDPIREPREETPTPPADEVPGVNDLAFEPDNVAAESGEESEEEWNYIKVEPSAVPAEGNQQVPSETCQTSAKPPLDDPNMDSQLNPDAAEFVPSPTQLIPSMEVLLSESPRKGIPMEDILIPSQIEFQKEVCQRPGEIDVANESSLLPQQKLPDLIQTDEGGDINPFLPPGAICEKNINHLDNRGFSKYLEQGDSNFQGQNSIFLEQTESSKESAYLLDESEISSTKAEFGDDSTCFMTSGSEVQKNITESMSFLTAEKSFTDVIGIEFTSDVSKSDFSGTLDNHDLTGDNESKLLLEDNFEDNIGDGLDLDASAEKVPLSFELQKEIVPEMESKPERVQLESEGTSSFEQDDSGSPLQTDDIKETKNIEAASPPISPITDFEFVPEEANKVEHINQSIQSMLESSETHSPIGGATSPVPCSADTTVSTPETIPLEKELESPLLLETSPLASENILQVEVLSSPVKERSSLQEELLSISTEIQKSSMSPEYAMSEIEISKQAATALKVNELELPKLIESDKVENKDHSDFIRHIENSSSSSEQVVGNLIEDSATEINQIQEQDLIVIESPLETPAPVIEEVAHLLQDLKDTQISDLASSVDRVAMDETGAIVAATTAAATVATAVAAGTILTSEETVEEAKPTEKKEMAVEMKKSASSQKEKKGPLTDKVKTSKTPTGTKPSASSSVGRVLQKSTPTSPTKPPTTLRSSTPKKPLAPSTTTLNKVTKSPAASSVTKAKTIATTSPTKPISANIKPTATNLKARPSSANTSITATKSAVMTNGDVDKPPAIKKTTTSTSKPPMRPVTAPATTKTATTKQTTTLSSRTSTLSATAPKPKLAAMNGTTTKPRTTNTTATARNKLSSSRDTKIVTDKQVKETANKQISSARQVNSKSGTTVTTRTMTTTLTRKVPGVAQKAVTTTTTTVKSSVGNKIGTKKTTTATRTSMATTKPTKTEGSVTESNETVQVQQVTGSLD